jgi:hypothetical protein
VEWLKVYALSSSPSTAQKKKKERKKENESRVRLWHCSAQNLSAFVFTVVFKVYCLLASVQLSDLLSLSSSHWLAFLQFF